ncbi:origin recognition complex subunit 6-like isoform X1 [Amphiura filiformis]|uniref:origin recognition complex subunit 6-like isoform X1 n=2 Tax=Amphiura filiformis TaxID=82378 RepID=UPI003B20B71C
MDSKVAKSLADKLGVTSPKIVRKASELNRLCDVRCTSGSLSNLGLNETSRTVMCIELAATSLHHHVDRKEAIRLAGVSKKIYVSSYKTLETMLDLQQVHGMRDLAVQFGCIGAVDLARDILSRYKSDYITRSGSDNDIDFSKPMFTLAALYTVCRHQKVKVDKTKMVATAGVKRSTFDQTCTDLEKYATQLIGDNKKTGKGKQKYWLDDLEKSFEEEEESPIKKKKTETTSDESGATDDYEEWKRKILEGASAATRKK